MLIFSNVSCYSSSVAFIVSVSSEFSSEKGSSNLLKSLVTALFCPERIALSLEVISVWSRH